MEKDVARIADKINIDNLTFCLNPRGHRDRAVVTFSASNKLLNFNPKMTKLLAMRDWSNVIVGYDRKSRVLVLKQCEHSEFGSTTVRTPSRQCGSDRRGPDKLNHSRTVCIGAVAETLGICKQKVYRAERNGNMIFLEELEKEE